MKPRVEWNDELREVVAQRRVTFIRRFTAIAAITLVFGIGHLVGSDGIFALGIGSSIIGAYAGVYAYYVSNTPAEELPEDGLVVKSALKKTSQWERIKAERKAIREYETALRRQKEWQRKTTLSRLTELSPKEFEHYVADLWEQLGYRTRVTQQSNDRGVDIVATRGTRRIAIQAKRYTGSNRVGRPAVQQYGSLYLGTDGFDEVIIVTTGGFTQTAIDEASDLDVRLVGPDELLDLAVDAYEQPTVDVPEILEQHVSA